MPLIQIQYSANLDGPVAIPELVGRIHEAGLGDCGLPLAALRTMAFPVRDYAVADRNPENAFVHVIVRMRRRDEEERKKIGDALFGALTTFMDSQFKARPLALSLEFVEIDTWRKNNMHDRLK